MYDIFEQLLQKNNTTAYQVAKSTGISTGSLTDWKMGRSTPKQNKLDLIANFFKVDPRIFKKEEYQGLCFDCGMHYNPQNSNDITQHDLKHAAWEKAVNHFGFCWTYNVRENAKSIARNRIAKGNLSLEEKVEANIEIFKALFSRSLASNDFDLLHVDFEKYVSMLLYQNQFHDKIDAETYKELVNKYGVQEGIKEGETYYYVPVKQKISTIAAHREDSENWTPEELQKIEDYKKLLLRARNSKE